MYITTNSHLDNVMSLMKAVTSGRPSVDRHKWGLVFFYAYQIKYKTTLGKTVKYNLYQLEDPRKELHLRRSPWVWETPGLKIAYDDKKPFMLVPCCNYKSRIEYAEVHFL